MKEKFRPISAALDSLAGFERRWSFVAVWIFLLILAPIAGWTGGQTGLLWLINLGVLSQVAASLALLSLSWPPRRVAALAALALPLAWAAEWFGSRTGLLFGRYHYTDLLQPQLGGVPLLIPLAWLMMLPSAWAVAAAWVSPRRRWAFAAVAGLAFTAWDLYLDPQMVGHGLWAWDPPGAYFGIPLHNFAGWWLVSTLLTRLVAPQGFPQRPLAALYGLTWVLQVIGLGVFWGQPGPALCGFVGMGFFMARYIQQEWKT